MKSRLIGHLSEAEVWPWPWVEQVGMQESCLTVCVVDRQVGHTNTFEQARSLRRWECFRQMVQYLGVMWIWIDLFCFRMRVCWSLVSTLRKAWAVAGELKVTSMHWGGLRVVSVLCWIRWVSIMLGYCCWRFLLKVRHASSRVWGASVSQNRKRLSGRFDTNMVDSLASGGGDRRVNLCWVSCWANSAWSRTFCFLSGVWKLKMTIDLS